MPIVEESIVVNRPRADVFGYVADSETLLDWWSNNVEFVAKPAGMVQSDTVTTGVTRVAGRKVAWTAKVTDLEDGVTFTYTSTESPIPFTYSYRFEDAGAGTRVTFRQESQSFGGFFGKLADPIVTRMYSRDVAANLANLKELLES